MSSVTALYISISIAGIHGVVVGVVGAVWCFVAGVVGVALLPV